MSMQTRGLLGLTLAALGGTVSTPAWTADEAASAGPKLEEVMVYAEAQGRRHGGAGSAHGASTPSTASIIEQAQMVSVTDIGRIVPNAQLDPVGTFPGFSNFVIRGVGNTNSTRSIDAPVNILQDGMVIDYQAGAVLDTFDAESVEVLRGPQGVLFGRNASGGAIVLRSRRPTGDFNGNIESHHRRCQHARSESGHRRQPHRRQAGGAPAVMTHRGRRPHQEHAQRHLHGCAGVSDGHAELQCEQPRRHSGAALDRQNRGPGSSDRAADVRVHADGRCEVRVADSVSELR